ncbi:MAG TPA: hypothetical protein VM531_11230 [Sphingomicrobium sp.]|jgi:hypothetical protein|nr:hypothetical protein [Sphingomicrobium sp.]
MSTDRRTFIKGLLVSTSAAAGTALVKLASPEDVKALEVAQPALIGQPMQVDNPFVASSQIGHPVFMKIEREFRMVGLLTEIRLESPSPPIDLSSWSGVDHQYIRGLPSTYGWGRFEIVAGRRQ